MQHRKLIFGLITAGVVFLLTTVAVFLLPPQDVSAQCGSQASSCKNCHETQAQDPVNNDGTAWHTEHAFGDFCYLCHAGNNQATDKTAAHTGMEDPLSDIVASCKACHANDFEAKAQIYATTLGVTIGSSASSSAGNSNQPVATTSPVSTPPAPAAAVPAADMVDYTQRYDETVLGEKPVNVGNVILIIMIAAMLFGGGFFILRRENLVKISFQDTKQIKDGYPADVVDIVPAIVRLNPMARKDLRKILAKPGLAAELFSLVAKLSGGDEKPVPPPDDQPKG